MGKSSSTSIRRVLLHISSYFASTRGWLYQIDVDNEANVPITSVIIGRWFFLFVCLLQPITCRAAVAWEANTPLVIETIEVAPPNVGEVRVKLVAAGVCHSDENFRKGHSDDVFPGVFGHEASGIIESIGEGVRSVKPGITFILNVITITWLSRNCLTMHIQVWVPSRNENEASWIMVLNDSLQKDSWASFPWIIDHFWLFQDLRKCSPESTSTTCATLEPSFLTTMFTVEHYKTKEISRKEI